jgi:catechol 2,3-dioxygenase-like lactoylglutathione lyase family enzyme
MKTLIVIVLIALLFIPGLAAADTLGPPTPLPSKRGLTYHAHHVALRVADLEQSVDWWNRVMGAREVRRSQIPNISAGTEIALMHISGGFHIELIGGGRVNTPPGLPPEDIKADYGLAGWKHVGFYVADMEAALAHLKSEGVTAEYDIIREDYGVRIVLFKELNGYFIELYAPVEVEGDHK